jgi:hypothetical protein
MLAPALDHAVLEQDRKDESIMDSITTDFWDVLLWSFWFFIWMAALMVWFRCLVDLFGDRSLSGWGKAGWALLLILVPWLGGLVYLVARGRSMAERQATAAAQVRGEQERYIKDVAGGGRTAADQISEGKTLLDSGAISDAEFDALKAKALA